MPRAPLPQLTLLSGRLIVLSAAYWLALNYESWANGQASPIWLFRRIRRRRGSYIITKWVVGLSKVDS